MTWVNRFRRLTGAVLISSAVFFTTDGRAASEHFRNQWEPTTLEIAQLPAYCHGQFIPEQRSVWLSAISSCGTYMNHFCPGLVLINRVANLSRPRGERRENLRMAQGEIEYTRRFLKQPCALEEEIQGAEARIKALQLMIR